MTASPWFIVLAIAFGLLIVFLAIIIFERIFFIRKLKEIQLGMTGKEIEKATGYKIKIIDVDMRKNAYTGQICSPMKFFSYNLYFKHGRYIRRERNYRKR